MLIVRPDSLPRFWWLYPWTVCRQLHKNAVALRLLCDRQDAVIQGKTKHSPRYSVFISGKEGAERRYYFRDHATNAKEWMRRGDGFCFGEAFYYDGASKGFTSYSNPDDAIRFCEYLNSEDAQS